MNNRVLNTEEYELFSKILKSSQGVLLETLGLFLNTLYGEDRTVITNDYIIAFGDIPVGLVAHLDTFHKTRVSELFYDRENNVMWSPQGLGADDRAGVYAILKILKYGFRPTVIFTTDEEIGGIGAKVLIKDLPEFPGDLNFLIELDRKGENDCVFYSCENDEFDKYIESYGFKSDWGSFSDISHIAPAWGVAATNLSIGYIAEHSTSERLYVNWMFDTIDKVCKLLSEVKEEDKFEYIAAQDRWMTYYSSAWGDFLSTKGGKGKGEFCWECLNEFGEEELIHTLDGGVYCGECYAKRYSTCVDCKEEFLDVTKTHLLCEKCRGGI